MDDPTESDLIDYLFTAAEKSETRNLMLVYDLLIKKIERIAALEEGLREIAEQCPYGHAGATWAMNHARTLLGGKDE